MTDARLWTVRELIEVLQAFDPNLPIMVADYFEGCTDSFEVEVTKYGLGSDEKDVVFFTTGG